MLGWPLERAVTHPDVGEDAIAFLATPGTVARSVARSLESTTRKGIVAHATWIVGPRCLLQK